MKMPEIKILLVVISLLLFGILGFLVLGNPDPQTLGEAIDEAAEEIGDEIDDRTTSGN